MDPIRGYCLANTFAYLIELALFATAFDSIQTLVP